VRGRCYGAGPVSPTPPRPGPPPLPANADPALVEFVGCHTEQLTLASGSVSWLPMPPAVPSFLGHPHAAFARAGTAVIVTVRFGLLSLKLRAEVVNGTLVAKVEGKRSFGLRDAIERWVRDVNAHLAANGRKLSSITTDGRTATITKAPLT
jgi:hypothetical protein